MKTQCAYCLIHLLLKLLSTKRLFVTIAFKFALELTNGKDKQNQEWLKLYSTLQLLVHAGDVNLLAQNIYIIEKNTAAFSKSLVKRMV